MRFEDIEFEESDFDLGNGRIDGVYYCIATNELSDIANTIRKRQGNTDLVSLDNDNEVFYRFYIYFNTETKEVKLWFEVFNGEKDDSVQYGIQLFQEEKEMLVFKVIKELMNELNNK